jgi:hypothetical protein
MLLDQQHLVSVMAGKAIRAEDIEPIHRPGRSVVAQTFQRRPEHGGAGVAVIDVAVIGLRADPILSQTGLQGRDLAVDRSLGAGIGDPGIKGDTQGLHGLSPELANRIRGHCDRLGNIAIRRAATLKDRYEPFVDFSHDALTQPGGLEAHPDRLIRPALFAPCHRCL